MKISIMNEPHFSVLVHLNGLSEKAFALAKTYQSEAWYWYEHGAEPCLCGPHHPHGRKSSGYWYAQARSAFDMGLAYEHAANAVRERFSEKEFER